MKETQTLMIHISRSFPATREALYKAWTDPDQLKQWWHPLGRRLKDVTNDVRPGGRVAYHFDDGLEITGEYSEVQDGRHLVYSWNWNLPNEPVDNAQYLLRVDFREEGGESVLEVRQENFSSQQAIKPHQEGWEHALDRLEDFLEASR
jgi:uncharacterized protein YndB with AHSA1/START domain